MFYLITALILGIVIVGSIVVAFATRNKSAFGESPDAADMDYMIDRLQFVLEVAREQPEEEKS